MKTRIFGSLVLFILAFISVRAEVDSVAREKLNRIPPAPANVFTLHLSKQLIVLVVRRQGVFINDSKKPVPFDQVLKALADLPKEAWPYGRSLICSIAPIGLESDEDRPLPDDAKKIEADLKAAKIQFAFGGSA